MSMDLLLTSLFVLALLFTALWQIFGSQRRSQSAVATELFEDDESAKKQECLQINGEQFDFSGDGGALGLYRPALRIAFMRKVLLMPWVGAIVAIAFRLIAFPLTAPVSVTVSLSVLGFAIGYLVGQASKRAQAQRWERQCQFCLPLTMERLVMAVQAGLDLLAAVNVVLKDEEETPTNDPVLELLAIVMKLTESGLPFEQALKEVGSRVPLTAIRHAFTHLAIAHREGGELVMPLKELSDATQSFYQETVEEEIARLPVKATLPLLCTFAGLIIFFITSPLIQVITMTAGVSGNLK